jgi:hypothetical protein
VLCALSWKLKERPFLSGWRAPADLDAKLNVKAERMRSSILLYGSAQSLIGFVGGFYLSKLVHTTLPPVNPYMTGGYGYVKSDDDVAEV